MKHTTFNRTVLHLPKHLIGFVFFFFFQVTSFSASPPNSIHPRYKISLLTYSPGKELYSAFGHSAIRVVDYQLKTDVVYNYGTFSFRTPNFYGKFIKGKLPYFLSRVPIQYVIKEIDSENRSIIENEILLKDSERSNLVRLLKENYRPENRYYLYDFLFDNCATRIIQIVDSASYKRFTHSLPDYTPKSFSRLVSGYLGNNRWGDIGIKVITGALIHEKASMEETCFLPDYLQNVMKASYDTVTHEPMLGKDQNIIPLRHPSKQRKPNTPLFVFLIIFILVLIIKITKRKKGKPAKGLDYLVLLPPIIIGTTLLVLWAFSNHDIYAWNYSLLWANPFWILILIHKTAKYKMVRAIGHILLAGGAMATAVVLFSMPLTIYIGTMWTVLLFYSQKTYSTNKH